MLGHEVQVKLGERWISGIVIAAERGRYDSIHARLDPVADMVLPATVVLSPKGRGTVWRFVADPVEPVDVTPVAQ